ncbi:MAG: DNA/RNA nuclease SfsA [Desulfurococcales archaeon]|nr:DNA/RNA nuclease SfsA [Desulfurococcales archaeon]
MPEKNDRCNGVELFRIPNISACEVRRRVNRFVVEAELARDIVRVHNTNTGRLEDILFPGSTIYCAPRSNPGKTTHYVVGSTIYGGSLINTRLQEDAFHVAVEKGVIRWLDSCRVKQRAPRVSVGRLDFLLECNGDEVFVELKSAVLRGPNGEAMYPDCPTERGRKHIQELAAMNSSGHHVLLVFIAGFPGATAFKPYKKGDPLLAEVLANAVKEGLTVRSVGVCLEVSNRTGIIRLYNDYLPILIDK